MRDKYVTSAVAQSYRLIAEQHGMGEAEFLARTGLQRGDLDGRHGRVSRTTHLRTLQLFDGLGIVPLPEPGGFDDVDAFYPDLVGVLANSATLRDALRHLVTYRPVMGTVDQMAMREAADQVLLVYEKTDSRALSSASVFGMFMLANKIADHYGDRSDMTIHIGVQGRLPGPARSLVARADCRVRDDQAHNTWRLSGAALDRPFACFNPHVERYARQRLDRQLRDIDAAFSLAHQVSGKILEFLRAAPAQADDERLLALLCERLGMSRWTLRRHLGLEGTTFSDLLARTRCEEMRHLLAHSDLSIAEIGDRLGFATPASLSRFARRHLGAPPSAYRERLRMEPRGPGHTG